MKDQKGAIDWNRKEEKQGNYRRTERERKKNNNKKDRKERLEF